MSARMGGSDLEFVEIPIRIRYADTDQMGIVYYGNYPAFFEVGRSEYMRQKGYPYRDVEEMGYYFVVVGLEAKYYGNATYDDVVVVKTRVTELKSRGITFHYVVTREGVLVVEGTTKHICVNSDKKPVTIPPKIIEIFRNGQTA